MAEPSRRIHPMPVRARPRLHPVIVGNNNHTGQKEWSTEQTSVYCHVRPGGTVAVNAMVAAAGEPGQHAEAPARTQGAAPFGVAWGRAVGVFDHHRHFCHLVEFGDLIAASSSAIHPKTVASTSPWASESVLDTLTRSATQNIDRPVISSQASRPPAHIGH